jgi:hypothetical protein
VLLISLGANGNANLVECFMHIESENVVWKNCRFIFLLQRSGRSAESNANAGNSVLLIGFRCELRNTRNHMQQNSVEWVILS